MFLSSLLPSLAIWVPFFLLNGDGNNREVVFLENFHYSMKDLREQGEIGIIKRDIVNKLGNGRKSNGMKSFEV